VRNSLVKNNVRIANTPQANPEQANPEQTNPAQANSEQANSEQALQLSGAIVAIYFSPAKQCALGALFHDQVMLRFFEDHQDRWLAADGGIAALSRMKFVAEFIQPQNSFNANAVADTRLDMH
jgi:hypothetical protein